MSAEKSKRSYSIVRFFLLSLLSVTVISTAIFGYLWISDEYGRFSEDTARFKQDYLDAKKEKVREETGKVFDYIRYVRSNTDIRLRELLKERVYEAHSIAGNIYREYRGKKPVGEIKRLIKEALRPIRFSRGRGYLYIHHLNGTLELYPVKPNSEGQNQINLRDKTGVFVVKREVELIRKQNEGFLVNTWRAAREAPGRVFTKVSFVKYFKPLEWYIGSKEYREDFTREIQEEILARVSKIRFGKNGYIFVINYDGVLLMNDTRRDLIGKNLWNIRDENGIPFVKEMKRTVEKNNSGFVEYTWSKPASRFTFPKISFVSAIHQWRWIIGAGIYLDEIGTVIAEKHGHLKNIVHVQVIKIIGLFVLISVLVFLFTVFVSRHLRRQFDVFISGFKESSITHAQIEINKLSVSELQVLGESANQMLKERSRIEKSLKESEERLEVTFRSIRDGVIATDTAGRIVLMNRAAEEQTGRYLQNVIGKPVESVLNLEDENSRSPILSPVYETLESGKPVELQEAVLLPAVGVDHRPISCSAAPIRDQKNDILGAVMVFQDISDRKKMEEELRKAHKLESLGVLAGGIAHDFNNLLTGIMGNITLAKTLSPSNESFHTPLDRAEKAVLQSKRLTQQLLTFARGSEPLKQFHHVEELVEEPITFSLRGSRCTCNFDFPDGLWTVNADAGQIFQVFNNIALNAVQAMPEGGRLEVKAENVTYGKDLGLPLLENKYVRIDLKDQGVGIPDPVIKQIFDPYFTTKPKGSGLGLTTAYSIVKKHEGCIDVRSEPGKETVFSVYIPAVERDIKRIPEKEAAPPEQGEGRILVMDDDIMVANAAEQLLEHLGYRVDLAKNGSEAIAQYKDAMQSGDPFLAVIMDLTIPGGMGGAEAIKKLLQLDPHIKAIVSSGYSTDPVMANYKSYGFSARIAKPYLLKDLSKTLKDCLQIPDA